MQCPRHIVLFTAVAASLALGGCDSNPSGGPAGRTARAPAEIGLPIKMKPREMHAFIQAHPEALLLDVRSPSEWNDDVGHLEGSRQIPLTLLGGRLTEIEGWKKQPVVTISRIGDRGAAATLVLREAGFTQVTNLEGGLEAWRDAGY
jgi:rhodanese-related sulfurtransferase